jgi:hypothetical protein
MGMTEKTKNPRLLLIDPISTLAFVDLVDAIYQQSAGIDVNLRQDELCSKPIPANGCAAWNSLSAVCGTGGSACADFYCGVEHLPDCSCGSVRDLADTSPYRPTPTPVFSQRTSTESINATPSKS